MAGQSSKAANGSYSSCILSVLENITREDECSTGCSAASVPLLSVIYYISLVLFACTETSYRLSLGGTIECVAALGGIGVAAIADWLCLT
jgi:hypothetical protein